MTSATISRSATTKQVLGTVAVVKIRCEIATDQGEPMRSRTTMLAVATIVAAALQTAPSAAIAAETCQGRPATIVGTGPAVVGTPGDDVIVTGASMTVDAGAGNDLICLSPTASIPLAFQVGAGEGDDIVDASHRGANPVSARLGTGRDRYLGTAAADYVYTDGFDDDVTTGAGTDYVEVGVTRSATGVPGHYDGGPGAEGDSLVVRGSAFDIEIELEEQVRIDGAVAADVAGFQHAAVYGHTVTMRGNPENNRFDAWGCELRVDGEGGRDRLDVGYPGRYENRESECDTEGSTRLSGGTGNDRIYGWAGPDRISGGGGRDRLDGGPGRDTVDGGAGRDQCRAEVKRGCER